MSADPGSSSRQGRELRRVQDRLAGRFEVLGELGRGGMGLVLRARDKVLGREVALKLLLDGSGEGEASERRRERLRREGEIAAELDHPGIVKVFGQGELDGLLFLVCELVVGARPLAVVTATLPRARRVELVRDAARALAHAHTCGVVHRDVKPENLLVDARGRVRVTDFGLARDLHSTQRRLTRSGAMVGTPHYMSPEQLRGEPATPRSDVWGLGVVLYEALSGELPFPGDNLVELTGRAEAGRSVPLRERLPDIDRSLEGICQGALAPAPSDRPADAGAFADQLDAWLGGAGPAPPRQGRLPLLLGAAVLLAALLAGAALGLRPRPGPTGPEPAAPAPAAGLTLCLLAPSGGGAPVWTIDDALELEVRVDGAEGLVEVTAGDERRQAPAGRACMLRVPVPPGRSALVVTARDAGGRSAVLQVEVVRQSAPAWFRRLGAETRPALPFPAGVGFGEHAGEYVARDGSILVWVAPGRLRVGSQDGDPDEAPVHEVELRHGFFLGKFEVTWEQWLGFCQAEGVRPMRPPYEIGPDHPASGMSPDEADAFCARAGGRLPTEAEWEWAARGADGRPFPWGDARPGPRHLNANDSDDPWKFTSPVGSFPLGAAPCGALDMAGNVFEYAADDFGPYPAEAEVDPFHRLGPGAPRVIRGGAFNYGVLSARVANRGGMDPQGRDPSTGLRLCVPARR